jgi:5-methylcytosine-specific restriction endonuclease McrA
MSGIATEDDDMSKDTAAMSAPSAGYGRPHFIRRQKLCQLSSGMRERAEWARATAVENPAAVDVDDEMLPWVYNEAEGLWFSFDGNYSGLSPAEKREKRADAEARREEEDEAHRRWSAIRQQVLERDDYTCQMCGFVASSNLHIHHIMKRSEGGTDHLDNLLTLCPSCHSKADRKFYNPDWTRPPVE